MEKHFCDECGEELTAEELQHSLDMTGKELCSEHLAKRLSKKYVWKKENPNWLKSLTN